MTRNHWKHLSAAVLIAAFALTCAVSAHAQTLSATYFTIGETDKDANHLAGGTFTNEVQNTLGADGLPILNTAAFGCVTGCISGSGLPTDLTATGEITYWSPSLNKGGAGNTSDVVQTSTGTVSLPYVNNSFYPPNGTGSSDSNGFQAALFSGILNAPTTEQLSFQIASDDMAFVYIDGIIACDDGGVHGTTSVTCTTPTIAAGNNSISIFFVDINNTGSALQFAINTQGVTTAPNNPGPAPEPSTFIMLGTGLVGAVKAFRRRFSR